MQYNQLAITSFVLALLSWLPLINFVIAPLAVYFGWKSFKELKNNSSYYPKSKVFAWIGTIIGLLVTIFSYSWLASKLI